MEGSMDLNLKATELRLGLPGTDEPAITNDKKRPLADKSIPAPAAKSQIVGWPPVRSFRKKSIKKSTEGCGMYVKVSMDGAPYLRKIDLKVYEGYSELLKALQNMFNFTSERQYATTYEDKDGDWMLLGDVPWHMFISSCNKLRIIKASEPKGLT